MTTIRLLCEVLQIGRESWRLWYIRPTKYQVKIGDVNYYPDKGTIHVDGESRASERYLDGLEKILTRKNLLRPTRPKILSYTHAT